MGPHLEASTWLKLSPSMSLHAGRETEAQRAKFLIRQPVSPCTVRVGLRSGHKDPGSKVFTGHLHPCRGCRGVTLRTAGQAYHHLLGPHCCSHLRQVLSQVTSPRQGYADINPGPTPTPAPTCHATTISLGGLEATSCSSVCIFQGTCISQSERGASPHLRGLQQSLLSLTQYHGRLTCVLTVP